MGKAQLVDPALPVSSLGPEHPVGSLEVPVEAEGEPEVIIRCPYYNRSLRTRTRTILDPLLMTMQTIQVV
jgi:hypothetical protein